MGPRGGQQALQELEKLKEQAEPALRKALAEKPSREVARSVEELLGKLHPTGSPARLQVWRALEVLNGWARRRLARC